jgi:hypothetical protein
MLTNDIAIALHDSGATGFRRIWDNRYCADLDGHALEIVRGNDGWGVYCADADDPPFNESPWLIDSPDQIPPMLADIRARLAAQRRRADAAERVLNAADITAGVDVEGFVLCPPCADHAEWDGMQHRPMTLADMAYDLDLEREDDPDATLVSCHDCGASFAVRHGRIGWHHV